MHGLAQNYDETRQEDTGNLGFLSGVSHRGGSVNPLGTPPGGSTEGGQSPPSETPGIPQIQTPPLRVGEGDIGGEVKDLCGKASH